MPFAALLPLLKGTVGKAMLSSVASTAVSSLAQRSAAKAQRAQAVGDQAEQFVRLRDAAEAAGFNPLTVLRANPTGGMVNPTPALASGSFITDALGAGMETYFNRDNIKNDAERDMLQRELMRQELSNMQLQGKAFEKSMRFGYQVGNGLSFKEPPSSGSSWVTLPDGQQAYVKNAALASIGVKPGGYINVGQYQELVGEGRGEGEALLVADKVGSWLGIPLTGSQEARKPPTTKPAKAPNRAEIWRKQ